MGGAIGGLGRGRTVRSTGARTAGPLDRGKEGKAGIAAKQGGADPPNVLVCVFWIYVCLGAGAFVQYSICKTGATLM